MATTASRRSNSQSSYGSRRDRRISEDRIIDSDEESIEERVSDDDLLENFNATSQKKNSYLKSSGRGERDDGDDDYMTAKDDKMLMTMRKPWQVQTGRRSTSPRAARRMDLVDERDASYRDKERESYGGDKAGSRRGSRAERDRSNSISRSKSPVLKSQRSLSNSVESVEFDERTHTERSRTPVISGSRQNKSAQERLDDDDDVVLRSGSRVVRDRSPDQTVISSYRSDRSESPPRLHKSRDRRNSDDKVSEGHKTPRGGSGRNTPEDKVRDGSRSISGRSTPEKKSRTSVRQSGKNAADVEEGRKSPISHESQRRATSRTSDKGSPRERRRRTSKDTDEKSVRRGSVLDFMTDDSVPVITSSTNQDRRNNENDDQVDGVPNVHSRLESRRNSRESVKAEEDRSGFQEMVEEPGKKEDEQVKTEVELKTEEKLKGVTEKPRTEKQKVVNETLELVSNAQTSAVIASRDTNKKPPHQKNSATSLNKTSEVKPRPRSRYALPRPLPAGDSARRPSVSDVSNFGSTTDIRNAIFEEWSREAEKRKKQQQTEEKRRQGEKLEREKSYTKNDPELVQASYNAWRENKKEVIKKMASKKKEEEEQKRLKEEERREKKRDAEMNFLKWKEQKDSFLLDNHNKKLRDERKKEQQKKEKEQEKHHDSKSAYSKWMEEKEEEIKAVKREARMQEMRRRELERFEQEEKKADAHRLYVDWLQQKEEQQEMERRRKQLDEDDERGNKKPWRPSSHTVQFGRA